MKYGMQVRVAVFLSLSCLAGIAADVTELPGWTSDFHAATNRAMKTATPLVLLWGNRGCSHCQSLEASVQSDAFVKWREQSGYDFCFVLGNRGKDPSESKGARDFAMTAGGTTTKKPANYPYVCTYWRKTDGTVKAMSFTTDIAATLMSRADACFAGYQVKPAYVGGDLSFTNDWPCARLEAEVGITDYVDVPLFRTGDAAPFAATNQLVATFKGETILDSAVVWSIGETSRMVRVSIPLEATAGDAIAVTFLSGAERRGAVSIYVVPPQANSAKNPFFLGEKTKDALDYGEWTMDLDVALAKYKATPDAHLMVLAAGSCWCPDCVMTDHHILDRPEFNAWAVSNKVLLVVLDVPNLPNLTSSPSLLTRVVARVSDGYISARGTKEPDERERYQSGAGYLSRHKVSDAAATAVAARNNRLVGTNSANGGWNSPDRANQNRTGIPWFFALRRDGTLAGRLTNFDAIGPSEYSEAYLLRFDELLAMASDGADAGEPSNDSWRTTGVSFFGEGVGLHDTLTALDLVDTWKLASTAAAATLQTVTVKGESADIFVKVRIIAVKDGAATTLAEEGGCLADGVSVEGAISPKGDFYVQVEGVSDGALALDGGASSSAVSYMISGLRREIANPFFNGWISTAAVTTLPLYGNGGTRLSRTLALTLKKTKKLTAKVFNGKSAVASFSGAWDAEVEVDGTATATLAAKSGARLGIVMSGDGKVSAVYVDADGTSYTSGECELATSYAEFAGTYIVALPALDAVGHDVYPSGASFMSLSMAATASAKKKGLFKYKIFLADGKTLSGSTNVTGLDANFGIVPVLKTSGFNTVSAAVKLRRRASAAPSRRAVVAADDVPAYWMSTARGFSFERVCGVYGSYYDKTASLFDVANASVLKWTADVGGMAPSAAYGSLVSVAGDGARVNVTATKLSLAAKTKGFTFTFNRSTGIFSGKSMFSFDGSRKSISASYRGAVLPGWFTDCDCGEDDDSLIEIESIPFGLGHAVISDKLGRKTVKRGIAVGLVGTEQVAW